jgi:hypothetical protein
LEFEELKEQKLMAAEEAGEEAKGQEEEDEDLMPAEDNQP